MPFPGRNASDGSLVATAVLADRASDSQDAFSAVSEVGGDARRRPAPARPSVKTTSIYLAADEQRQEDVITRRERGWLTLDEDLDD